jgi:hypothetical protein
MSSRLAIRRLLSPTSLALVPALLLALRLGAAPAVAQAPDARTLEDDLQIMVLPQRILAVGTRGGQREIALEIGERVLWEGVRGRIGMVLTDRRALGVTTESGSWQSTRYRRTETVPDPPLLADRVALLLLRTRLVGLDGSSGNFVEISIGPGEKVVDWAVGQNVGVAVTSRRALGISAFAGGFFATTIDVGERIDGLQAVANSATLTTSRRLLTFRSDGHWEERRLDLRDRR